MLGVCVHATLMIVIGCAHASVDNPMQWQRLIRQHTGQSVPAPSSMQKLHTGAVHDMRQMKRHLAEEGQKMADGHVANPGSRPCPCSDPALCQLIKHVPDKEVFIFSVNESNWRHYDWNKITTIASPIHLNYPDEYMCHAHNRGIRIVFLVDYPKKQLTNSTARHLWVNAVINNMNFHFADGINMDFEGSMSKKEIAARNGLTALMKELTQAAKSVSPYTQISFDYWGNPYGDRHFDYKAISDVIDFAFLMDYDEISGPYGSPNAPYGGVKKGIEEFIALGIPGHNLLMGLPWYGYWFSCKSYDPKTHKCTRNALGQLCYDGIMDDYNKYRVGGELWDDVSKSPYFNMRDPKTGNIHQIWYDDPKSLRIKFGMIKTYNLRGAGNWQADCLDYTNVTQVNSMWGAFPKF